jgi:adenylate cyclase
MTAYLFVERDDYSEKVELDQANFLIGRLQQSDLTIQHFKVSRRHCRISEVDGSYVLEDLNSSNGTFVNDREVGQKELSDGDQIDIGESTLYFSRSEGGVEAIDGDATEGFFKDVDDIPNEFNKNLQDSIAEGSVVAEANKEASQEISGQRQDIDPFRILYMLGQEINKQMDLSEVLQSTTDLIQQVYSPRRCVILVVPPDGDELVVNVNWDRERGFLNPEEAKFSRSITEKAVDEQVSIISNNPYEDARFDQGQSIVDYNIQSAMCVPLWEQDEVFGAIYLDASIDREPFTDQDLDLLTAIGNQVAIRIKQEHIFEQLKQEAVIRKNFERFHSPDVAEFILEHSVEGKELSQELSEGEISILFVDIEAFTKMAEALKPRDVANILNRFYDSMSSIVFEHDGGVNKYIGDNVMAVFGAPVPNATHARDAVLAGKDMIEMVDELNLELPEEHQFRIRVGINSGNVVYGYVGSMEIKEFTVIGDPVNVADRLEKNAPSNNLLIGSRTAELIDDDLDLKSRGRLDMKGKMEPQEVYMLSSSAVDGETNE